MTIKLRNSSFLKVTTFTVVLDLCYNPERENEMYLAVIDKRSLFSEKL